MLTKLVVSFLIISRRDHRYMLKFYDANIFIGLYKYFYGYFAFIGSNEMKTSKFVI